MRASPHRETSLVHLYLARHGRTAWNAAGRFQGCVDVTLDDVGRAQAASLARSLEGRIDAVFASDLRRASETARIVSELLAIPLVSLEPDLRERGYGVFEGLTRAECIARFPDAWRERERERNFPPPGGEPHAEVITRMRRGLSRAVEAMRGRHQRALVVGHGSSLRMFLELLSEEPLTGLDNLEYREVLHDGRAFRLLR